VTERGVVVAIDGPAGAGKSTLARRLAEAMGLPYINTGLMYRAVAREALRRGVPPSDDKGLTALAEGLTSSLDRGHPPALLIDGRPPGDDLRTADVEAVVSQVSAHPSVRAVLRSEQRRLGRGGAVVEGRDIGTVVFPDATLKVFLRAEPGERAARRQAERGSEDPRLAEALAIRDELDARTNPPVPAPDAVVVETSGRDADRVLQHVLQLVRESAG